MNWLIMIKYTAYNTNGISYYDSFANFNLVTALVRSFHDSDLQQYAAFTTAVEQLIGSVDWVLDSENEKVIYISTTTTSKYSMQNGQKITSDSFDNACQLWDHTWFGSKDMCVTYVKKRANCVVRRKSDDGEMSSAIIRLVSTNTVSEEKTLLLDVVAAQVISNAGSGEDEVLQLLSQDYINLVANSIFDANTSKQFVKLEDLIPQLETNKILR